MIRDIAGRQNHGVKLARKLQKKKHRRERGLLVGEGMDLLEAAWQAGADIRDVLVRRDLLSELPGKLVERARRDAEPDGPGEFHVVLLDNGRTRLLPDPILVGRSEEKLLALSERSGVARWNTDLAEAEAASHGPGN